MEFPIWFTEAMQRRFELICVQLQQDEFIRMEHAQFNSVFQVFLRGLNEDEKAQFLQVEELWVRLEALEKEWIYTQGMKDGALLWMAWMTNI